jgi:hypothetical protein
MSLSGGLGVWVSSSVERCPRPRNLRRAWSMLGAMETSRSRSKHQSCPAPSCLPIGAKPLQSTKELGGEHFCRSLLLCWTGGWHLCSTGHRRRSAGGHSSFQHNSALAARFRWDEPARFPARHGRWEPKRLPLWNWIGAFRSSPQNSRTSITRLGLLSESNACLTFPS